MCVYSLIHVLLFRYIDTEVTMSVVVHPIILTERQATCRVARHAQLIHPERTQALWSDLVVVFGWMFFVFSFF